VPFSRGLAVVKIGEETMRRINYILTDKKTFQVLRIAGTILTLMGLLVAGVAAQPLIVPN